MQTYIWLLDVLSLNYDRICLIKSTPGGRLHIRGELPEKQLFSIGSLLLKVPFLFRSFIFRRAVTNRSA
jgi:hypothetical protein